ncbi:hypothetical protein [Streptomyces arboris]|uniref:hypothetical protein n=1 Tax=Streptomyces arboris TaxID=2600619 RepID=UPI003628611A
MSSTEERERLPSGPPVRRWRPVCRWILVAGSLILGLGIAASEAAMDDPKAELTVLRESPDGDCTVRYTDPLSGRERVGPFRCDPDRDPVLGDWSIGWVVSYGPWKGDLYNHAWQGTPANDVNDGLVLWGGLLTLGALLVGGVRVLYRVGDRRALARPEREPEPPAPRVSLVKGEPEEPPLDLSYAAVAAVAERRAPEETDPELLPPSLGREAPWWRDRTLLRSSQVPETLLFLAGGLVLGALWWWLREVVLLAWGLVATARALWLGRGAVREGIPAARSLARAAQGPGPVRRRYALLRRHGEETAVLVLFPLFPPAGGERDRAEGSLEVLPPGTRRLPWTGLPAPVGIVELYGDIDGLEPGEGGAAAGAVEGRPDDPSRPVVVRWTEGRPLWPLHGYDPVCPEDARDREYFTALLS